MRIHPAVQGSWIWMIERAKYLTASILDDWMSAKTFAISQSETAQALVAVAAGATVFNQVDDDTYQSAAMLRGSETEDQARAWYALEYDAVKEVGLCIAEDDSCACSPDGLVGDDGGIEVKCPKFKDHMANLASDTLRLKYVLQVQMFLLVTERKWCDWISYHPDLPKKVIRCYPDLEAHKKIKLAVAEFNRQKAVLVEKFEALKAE